MSLEATPIQVVKLPPQPDTVESLAASRAQATPLPGPVLTAFASDSISVAGVEVRKVVAFDYVFWQFTNSPLMQQLLELAKPEDKRDVVESTDEQEWELVLQFTNPPKRLRELMKKGHQAITDAAAEEVGHSMEPESVKLVLLAIFEQVKRNQLTANKYLAEAKEGGQITFFQENHPPA